jgi:trehalose synthase
VLLDDPHDIAGFGAAITDLLADQARARQIGNAARERVRDEFTSVRSLLDYAALVRRVL